MIRCQVKMWFYALIIGLESLYFVLFKKIIKKIREISISLIVILKIPIIISIFEY